MTLVVIRKPGIGTDVRHRRGNWPMPTKVFG